MYRSTIKQQQQYRSKPFHLHRSTCISCIELALDSLRGHVIGEYQNIKSHFNMIYSINDIICIMYTIYNTDVILSQ